MRAEHRSWSTRGTAPAYLLAMRNSLIVIVNLLTVLTLACSDDAPTRPEDGTVELWDACVWDGQETRALCQPELACAWHGICVPRCEEIDLCAFDGFSTECGISNEEDVCRVRCNEDRECPQTGGAPLQCLDFFCVREP